jgi:hypothetical protein
MGLSKVAVFIKDEASRERQRGWRLAEINATPAASGALLRLALLLGAFAVGGFIYMVNYSGGFSKVFSHGKPYLAKPSGYVGEMPMLAYPALLLLAMAWHGQRLSVARVIVMLLIVSPHLIMGTLGGRRGPAFLSVTTLGLCWFIIRDKRPSLRVVLGGGMILGLLMLFLVANRRNIHLGSDFDFDQDSFVRSIASKDVSEGQEYVCAVGRVLAASHFSSFDWGKQYVVTLLIRPIPRFIWPTKWKDLGMQDRVTDPGLGGFTETQWKEAVGFVPVRGSAGSFISDLYASFWWFTPLFTFLLGRLYAVAWSRSFTRGGVWTLIYIELLALSVYLPSQSIGAWIYRALLLCAPTALAWRYLLKPVLERTGEARFKRKLAETKR